MAFGGHFLSDVLLGGLISLLVDPSVGAARLIWPKRRTLRGLRAAARPSIRAADASWSAPSGAAPQVHEPFPSLASET